MNIGDTFYSLIDNIACYSVEDLRSGNIKLVPSLNVDTLNDFYGFDDASEDFFLKIPRSRILGISTERVTAMGREFVITNLKCTHYDDGHDGFLGIASSPSIDRDFEINLGFETKDVTTTKPQDFKEGNSTSNDKEKIPKSLGGSTGSGINNTDKKTSTGLIVGLLVVGLAIIGGLIYVFTRKK